MTQEKLTTGLWSLFGGAIDGAKLHLSGLARQIAPGDWLLLTASSRAELEECADFVIKFAHDAIDAGADAIIARRGLQQISDTGALEAIVDQVLAANPKSVEEFRAGKEKAFNALVGQAMKATRGKGNPAAINELLKKKLA